MENCKICECVVPYDDGSYRCRICRKEFVTAEDVAAIKGETLCKLPLVIEITGKISEDSDVAYRALIKQSPSTTVTVDP